MGDFLEAVPNNWRHRLIVPAVPRDGTPLEESFTLTLNKPVSYWAQIYNFTSPLEVETETCRTEGRLLTVISVGAEAEIPCSRCLEPAKITVNGELRYLFSLRPDEMNHDEPDGSADGDEDLIILDSWEDEIDLAPLIWEVLITSLPAAAVCSEKCAGLCPQCGVNLNKSTCGCKSGDTDPRFDVLRTFMEKKQDS